jgi:hypothetical protein
LGLLKEKSFSPSSGVNPFVQSPGNRSRYNRIKTVLLFPLGFLRLVLCILLAMCCALFCKMCLAGHKPEVEIGWFRRKAINLSVQTCCRGLLFVIGFYWIPVKGKRDRNAKLMIANHTTMLDVVVLLYTVTPSFLSKAGVLKVPLIGTICQGSISRFYLLGS